MMQQINFRSWSPPLIINLSGVFFILISSLSPEFLPVLTVLPLTSISSHLLLYPLRKNTTFKDPQIYPIKHLALISLGFSLVVFTLNLDMYFLVGFWLFFFLRSLTQVLFFYCYDAKLQNKKFGQFFYTVISTKTVAVATLYFDPTLAMCLLCIGELIFLSSLFKSISEKIDVVGIRETVFQNLGMFGSPACQTLEAVIVRFLLLSIPVFSFGSFSISLIHLAQVFETGFFRFLSRPVFLVEKLIYEKSKSLNDHMTICILLAINILTLALCLPIKLMFLLEGNHVLFGVLLASIWTIISVLICSAGYLFVDCLYFKKRNWLYFLARFPKSLGLALVLLM